jgi:formamidopyrimidine-DNA glycosylase
MPELPEVETVRRMLEQAVTGRRIERARTSTKPLRFPMTRGWKQRVPGRAITGLRRHGKYLLIDLEGGLTMLSHLGMSGRWLFHPEPPIRRMKHVHVRLAFEDGSELWFQDARRFGMLELHETVRVNESPLLAVLGPDPYPEPPPAEALAAMAGSRAVNVKVFLMDQKHVAGIGNIYASEILFRAGVHPERAAGRVTQQEWRRIRDEMRDVLTEAVQNFGTTFSLYRTLWNEPGSYAERLFVYDRAGEACRRCGKPIRHMVQGQRSTYWGPSCQPKRRGARPATRTAAAR